MKIKNNGIWNNNVTKIKVNGQWIEVNPQLKNNGIFGMPIIITITTNSTNLNLSTLFGVNWSLNNSKILIINPNVTVGATNVNNYALNIPSGMGGSLKLINYGNILGAGGLGGVNSVGGDGGNAIIANSLVTIDNQGVIYAGGGGGGSGGNGGVTYQTFDSIIDGQVTIPTTALSGRTVITISGAGGGTGGSDENGSGTVGGFGRSGVFNFNFRGTLTAYTGQVGETGAGCFGVPTYRATGAATAGLGGASGGCSGSGGGGGAASGIYFNNRWIIVAGGGGGGGGGARNFGASTPGGTAGNWVSTNTNILPSNGADGSAAECDGGGGGGGGSGVGGGSGGSYSCDNGDFGSSQATGGGGGGSAYDPFYSTLVSSSTNSGSGSIRLKYDYLVEGGTGGVGGNGQGYNSINTNGSVGSTPTGGTTGGTGGNGGTWGQNGTSGTEGQSGKLQSGLGGYSGGLAGFYIVNNGNVTWINTGNVLGRIG